MTGKQLKFDKFYELLLEAKEGLYEKNMNDYEYYVYANYRDWCRRALDFWLDDTELEEPSDKRMDEDIISKLTKEKGCTMAGWMKEVCIFNLNHHNIIEETAKLYKINLQMAKECSEEMLETAIIDIIDEYEIDMGGALDG